MVPMQEMNAYYDELYSKDLDFQRKRLNLIWSFKIKRNVDGSLSKHKARISCHGGQQELGISYWETCAPVVDWNSVKIIIIILQDSYPRIEINRLHISILTSRHQTSIYLFLLQGIKLIGGNCNVTLKLRKNLCGLQDTERTWYENLLASLSSMCFTSSQSDPCV